MLRGVPAQLAAQRGKLLEWGLWFRHGMRGCPLCGYRHGGKVGGLCTACQAKGRRRGRRVRRLVPEMARAAAFTVYTVGKGFPHKGGNRFSASLSTVSVVKSPSALYAVRVALLFVAVRKLSSVARSAAMPPFQLD